MASSRFDSSCLMQPPVQKFFLTSRTARILYVRAGSNSTPRKHKDEPAATVLEKNHIFHPSNFPPGLVPSDNRKSLARQLFRNTTEAALNDAINVAYSMSYVFNSMWGFFDRDNVGLPGLAEYFRYRSHREWEEAHNLMEYQNARGGIVHLKALLNVENEFFNSEKGEPLHAMELALSMEKVQNEKYQSLHKIAEQAGDADMCDYIVKNYVRPQSLKLKRSGEYISQLRSLGRGHGEYHFDTELYEANFDANPA